MLDAIIVGIAIVAISASVGALIKLGRIMEEFKSVLKVQEQQNATLNKHEDRLDTQDIVTATILTSLRYIEAGIDELRGRK